MAENIQSQNPLSAYFETQNFTPLFLEAGFYRRKIMTIQIMANWLFFNDYKDELMLKNPDALLNGKQ